MAAPAIGHVKPPSLPSFDPLQVRTPIVADEMTIWPGPKETIWDWLQGFPFELHPFAWDYMRISCDGYRVEIKPHYSESTWDTFWTDGSGYVTAQALGGLFPFTLGKEVNLIRGIIATLGSLPAIIAEQAPDTAVKIQEIHDRLAAQRALPPAAEAAPDLARWRSRSSEIIWRRKLRRLRLDVDGGSSGR